MDEKKQMNRRDFLKIVGISTVGATAAFYGCTPDKKKAGESAKEVPVGKMTYRQFPPNEDKVSLLGYGCMRWPTLPAPGGATSSLWLPKCRTSPIPTMISE